VPEQVQQSAPQKEAPVSPKAAEPRPLTLRAEPTATAPSLATVEQPALLTDDFIDRVVQSKKSDRVQTFTDASANIADVEKNTPLDELLVSYNYKGQSKLNELLDEEKRQIANFNVANVASAAGVSTGLSIGYVVWLLRGGVLLSSVLSSLPAWRTIDPLPVLSSMDADTAEDDDSLENMVSESANEEDIADDAENATGKDKAA